ncbi:NADH dehydrogenase [ubiquinone] 1 alpha subcomplex assembly factor 2 isoform X1 [Dendrobium catenatum]|uniref:NADH dehydrogenase [ubiquinone] 1 alpha subcomplex assembly factor 2 isoform X1 n=1 Tax=Dendrobium catenatum TaxID=906689 RepID=UPI0009F507E1|nr:NADH dehydrogenase [ubiquinone] 1 alpha subcomplex assembly factor 2 isoform X1 [Dendrobium catenatum]
MSRLFAKLLGFFSSRTLVGVDKAGNRYFTRKEEVDGIMKEKRRVLFKGEEDPTSIPVEWICWLNGQRKTAPTPEEMAELEAKRERIRQNVALFKKEEEAKKLANATHQASRIIGKDASPDLKSFIKQFPDASDNQNRGSEEASVAVGDESEERISEPTGSGESFKPGTWLPPT